MQEKKLGLPSIVATGVGLIIATSCLLSIGQGASTIGLPFIITMAIACAFNILTAFSICELNALMPNLTGGMAQYTLACFGPFVSIVITVGGYLTCQTIMGSSEAAMFGNTLSNVLTGVPIPGSVYSIVLILILLGLNLFGVDMFAKVQNIVRCCFWALWERSSWAPVRSWNSRQCFPQSPVMCSLCWDWHSSCLSG